MRVALVVDNPLRDLPGLVLVAYQLAKRGVTCFLVPLNLAWDELFSLTPDFVLLNYLRENNAHLAEHLYTAGISLGVLDTEGGVFSDPEVYFKTIARDRAVRAHVACYCSWGGKMASYLVDGGWYRQDQVEVTGCPRFDFYVGPLRDAAKSLSASYAGKYAPFVLVAGTFPLANPQFRSPEAEANSLVEQFGFPENHVREWQFEQKHAMHEMAQLVNMLAREFPQCHFVYRPHPFEKLSTYYKLLEQRDNIHLERQGTVDGWLLRARALVMRNCTTSIEATLAGVPVLSPSWIPVKSEVSIVQALSYHCRSYDELVFYLKDIIYSNVQKNINLPDTREIIEPWFSTIDGQAHRRVAETIEKHLKRIRTRPIHRKCAIYYYQTDQHDGPMWMTVKRYILRLFRAPKYWSFRRFRVVTRIQSWDHSEKYYSAQTVSDIVKAVGVAWGENDHIPVAVASASDLREYRYRHTSGRAVAVIHRSSDLDFV